MSSFLDLTDSRFGQALDDLGANPERMARGGDVDCAAPSGHPVAVAGVKKRVPTMVFSRVVGYYQPVRQWNVGKRQEFSERINYEMPVGAHPDNERR